MAVIKHDKSVHVRLSDEAFARLSLLCAAAGKEKSALLGEMAEESLLGKGHALTVAAERFVRMGRAGLDRDAQE